MNLKNLSMVAAQILVQKLLDSEILNQTICIQTEQGVVYVRFESVNGCVKTYHTLPDDAPGTGWRPSWVPEPEWEQMVQILLIKRTYPPRLYDWCLDMMLLMDIDWVGLGFITMDEIEASFVESGLVGQVVRSANRMLYYFDDNLIYRAKKGRLGKWVDPKVYTWPITCIGLWKTAATNFTVGMSFSECMEIFLTTERKPPNPNPGYTELELLVQKVWPPEFERACGNNDPNAIDFIRVRASLPRYRFSREELRAQIKAHKAEIDQLVVDCIQKSKRFQALGVPLNFFRLPLCVLRSDNQLEYLFELKPVSAQSQQ